MPAYLLDTNAISDLVRKQPKIRARFASPPGRVLTSVIVRGEVRYGIERMPPGKRRDAFERKTNVLFRQLLLARVTRKAADIYGSLRATLENQGLRLDDNDLWIAATALSLGAVLVSRDADFARVPGLEVEDWIQ